MTYDDAKDWIFENLPDYVPPPKPKVGDFSKWVFPVIANMMPQASIVDILTAVQPMEVPPGVFYQ